jgi:hypothetical protein
VINKITILDLKTRGSNNITLIQGFSMHTYDLHITLKDLVNDAVRIEHVTFVLIRYSSFIQRSQNRLVVGREELDDRTEHSRN